MFYQIWCNTLVAQAGEAGTSISSILESVDCSKYIVRKSLKQLQDVGFVKRVGNRFYTTLTGKNIYLAEVAAIQGNDLTQVVLEMI